MKLLNSKWTYRIIMWVGSIIFVGAILLNSVKGDDFHKLASGGIGLGIALIAISASLASTKAMEKKDPELFRKKNIEKNDERNILIRNKALAKANNILVGLIIAVIIVLSFFDVAFYIPLTLGAFIVVNGVFFILYYRYYNKRL